MLKAATYYLKCELCLLWRQAQNWLYPLGFFLIVISLFPLIFTPDARFLKQYMPGAIWLAALFACLLSMQTFLVDETEDSHLNQLLLSEEPLAMLMACKILARWLFTCLPLILLVPLAGVFFQLSANIIALLVVTLLIGTPVILLICSFSVALTLGLRQQGMLIGLMVFPLVIPVLIFSISIIHQWQTGLAVSGLIALLSGIALISLLFMPLAIALAARLSVDD